MKNRLSLLPLTALFFGMLACNLTMDAGTAIDQAQVGTFSAQTMDAIQWQTAAAGAATTPGETPVENPPPTAGPDDTPTNTLLPTVTRTWTQLPPSTTYTPTVTQTPVPCNWAQFISDVTIPDNWETTPNDHFTKTWRLKNIGSCTWTSGYALVFDHGDQMGAPASQQLTTGTVAPGQTIDVSVDLLSPAADGTYQGYFKLKASDSSTFGIGSSADGAFWVKIVVAAPPPAVSPETHREYSQVTVTHGTVGHTTAFCPSGTVVTGGGYNVSSTGMWVYIQRKNSNGWVVYVQNNSTVDKTLTVYAVCLTYPSVSVGDLSNNTPVTAGHSEDLITYCPTGTVVVGGGYTGLKEGTLITTYSGLSGNGWRVSETNTGSGIANFNTYALCLSGVSASTAPATAGHVDISPSSTGYAEAVCPAGGVMTSGGFSFSGEELTVYYTSWYNGKWRVYARNTSTHTQALTVRGTCLSVP
ncbi:MAG: NBR1-Ig-like domain-containing protein [Anaerolineales bacterium]